MPSFGGDHDATTALQTIANGSLGATTLKGFEDNPFTWKLSTTSVSPSLSGRYTPLNTPFQNGTGKNGITNGVKMNGTLSPNAGASKEKEDSEKKPQVNGDRPTVNGDKAAETAEEKRISTVWHRIFPRPPGLKNFSNTCYMNSTLQALMHVPPLVIYLLRGTHSALCSKNSQVCAFCRLERHARESYEIAKRGIAVEPLGIIGKSGVLSKFYNIHKQEDAHELFLHLLDKMDEADKRAHHDPKHKSIIQDIFAGECRQSITCDMETCGHVSHTSQAFMDLSLDLLTRERDIMSSLHDFTRQETLSADNQYKCEKCNAKTRAKKSTTIHVAPPILSIHLKRFSVTGIRKNTALITYPEVLDLNPYMSEESRGIQKYTLIATVCHHGFDYSGMSSGHYTANCKSSGGTWNHFDDTRINATTRDEVLRDRDAYILFYARDDPPGMSKPPIPLPSFGSSRSPINGVNGTQPSSSGQKRVVDEISDDESPPKRRRVSDAEVDEISDDDSAPLYKPSPKHRPTSLSVNISGHLSSKPTTTTQKAPERPPFTSANNHINQPLPRQSHRPYTPKVMPQKVVPQKVVPEKEKRGPDATGFWNTLHPEAATKSAPPVRPQKYESTQNVQKLISNPGRKHQVRPDPGHVTNDDPFAQGYQRARIQGIAPQGFVGATRSFNEPPASSKSKMDQQRNGLGIKVSGVRRKHLMRS